MNQDRLKQLITYSPDSGVFVWNVSRGRISAGDIAGTFRENGYILIRLDGKDYRAHRLAFLYMTGEFPAKQVDHINRVRNDNRWCNLRDANQSLNSINTLARSNTGAKGIHLDTRYRREPYRVQVRRQGKYIHVGAGTLADAIVLRQHLEQSL